MEKHKGVYRTLGSLLALPVLGGYVLAVLIMAALMIALTNEPVFTVSQDAYSTLGYHRPVEPETKNLRATGKVEQPGIRPSLATRLGDLSRRSAHRREDGSLGGDGVSFYPLVSDVSF